MKIIVVIINSLFFFSNVLICQTVYNVYASNGIYIIASSRSRDNSEIRIDCVRTYKCGETLRP